MFERLGVSRETLEALSDYVALLLRWNARINLIGRATEADVWSRHIADSAQLLLHRPEPCRDWVDLGAGAGLPGIVLAIITKSCEPRPTFTLVEADARKAAFLREAARALSLEIDIQAVRIERLELPSPDVLSARALAPIATLLEFAEQIAGAHTCLLFPKGRSLDRELTDAERAWHIQATRLPSLIDPEGAIVKIAEFRRK